MLPQPLTLPLLLLLVLSTTQVRTFVSAVNLSVGGVHVLDDTKLATLAATAGAGLGLLLGAPLPLLFWGGFVLPFFAAGLAARFWPLLRTVGLDLLERYRNVGHKFWQTGAHGGELGFC